MTDRHIQGAKVRAQGKAFEERIEAALAWYAFRGLAGIDKTPEPMKVIKSMGRGQFLACFTKKAQPDFTGTLQGGRSVMFEAKYTVTDRLAQSKVLAAQEEYLNLHESLGAECYVIAGFSTGNVYRIPWRVWRDMKDIYGRKYVREKDIQDYRVKQKNGRLWLLDGMGGTHEKI